MCDVVHVCTSSSSHISSAAGAETCENVDLFLAAPSHSTLTWPVRRPAPPPVNGPSGIFDDLFATSQPLGISLFASGGAWPNLPIGPAFQCVIFCSFLKPTTRICILLLAASSFGVPLQTGERERNESETDSRKPIIKSSRRTSSQTNAQPPSSW